MMSAQKIAPTEEFIRYTGITTDNARWSAVRDALVTARSEGSSREA